MAGCLNKVFTTLGASNHTADIREVNDFYATDPRAAELLLMSLYELNNIWEPACGEGHLAEVFQEAGKLGKATDLIWRGYGDGVWDFLETPDNSWRGDIVTNPPYKLGEAFVKKALRVVPENRYVCMFLKLTFLEGKARKAMFKETPPERLLVSSSRITCAKNGEFENYPSSAIAYGWFIWKRGFTGKTTIDWIN